VARTVRFEDMERMSGVITADAAMRARMSHLEQGRYEQVSAEGGISIAQLVLEGMDLPHALLIEEAVLRLTPQHAELSSFRGRIGASDIALAGELDNLIGFLLRADDLRGRARLTSSFFDLDEWRSEDAMQAIVVPGRIDFELDAAVERPRSMSWTSATPVAGCGCATAARRSRDSAWPCSAAPSRWTASTRHWRTRAGRRSMCTCA
jgi:hypothetical protein